METYLVGGSVRDRLLGIEVTDRDWVVVGVSEQQMTDQGFVSVGADFPVFLHPETKEEYALARTERKTGPGHTGFECRSDPDVTLEQDLERRDLTINAIAETESGELIDPFGGQADIEARALRHVSDAFAEDPLRILRVARFKARLHHLGFSIHPATRAMLKEMITRGEHKELTAERVLLEVDKALATQHPAEFFTSLDELGATATLWPELSKQDFERLTASEVQSADARLAILLLNLTPDQAQTFCRRLKTSKLREETIVLVVQHLEEWQLQKTLSAAEQVELVLKADGVRKANRFRAFNSICEAITGAELEPDWQGIQSSMAAVKASDLNTDVTGPALGELIKQEQIRRVGELS